MKLSKAKMKRGQFLALTASFIAALLIPTNTKRQFIEYPGFADSSINPAPAEQANSQETTKEELLAKIMERGPVMLNVPYYSQHIGRFNYCLPASLAMVADFYGKLIPEAAGTQYSAPKFIADELLEQTRSKISGMHPLQRKKLGEILRLDDALSPELWLPEKNERGDIGGMYVSTGYMILEQGMGLKPEYGSLADCIEALYSGIPSILTGPYGIPLRLDGEEKYKLADGRPYEGTHAFVLVGADRGIIYINDPLPADKLNFSGRKDEESANKRAVPFDFGSVYEMASSESFLRKDMLIIRL